MCENALPIHSCHFSSFSILHTLALIHDIRLNPIKIEHDCFLYCGVTEDHIFFTTIIWQTEFILKALAWNERLTRSPGGYEQSSKL